MARAIAECLLNELRGTLGSHLDQQLLRRANVSAKISVRHVGDVTIMDVSGRITMGEGSVGLRDAVQKELANGSKKIILNLADVSYMDSSGLGELTSAYTSAKNQGAEVKLLNLTKKIHDLLQITKLSTIFSVSDDEKEAVASFQG
jgi:anti-sigma B factor antagonist